LLVGASPRTSSINAVVIDQIFERGWLLRLLS
jgi:hypothetical protein